MAPPLPSFYTCLSIIVDEANAYLHPPIALRQLAEITDFNLFLTTTFDSLMESALNEIWGFCITPRKGSIQDRAARAVSVSIRISANSRTISSTLTDLWLFTELVAPGVD